MRTIKKEVGLLVKPSVFRKKGGHLLTFSEALNLSSKCVSISS